ncbi:MAG TPA: AAA family ATPase [Steroidobacteraceae bacterium]|nr:AAA family ATPase [Steroidobacteraceae bacterium]
MATAKKYELGVEFGCTWLKVRNELAVAEFSYADLVAWARERLPLWQQDALRRLAEERTLSDTDVTDLASMALARYVTNTGAPTPVPPIDDLKLSATKHPCVQVSAVRDMARVNALARGPVAFGLLGLTAIYGANASGKSGLARILKRACHARDPGGRVLSNVFETDTGQPASATIEFVVDGEVRRHNWIDGSPSDPLLKMVNVFDSRCAAVQVEKPNRILYTPEILHLFRALAEVIDRVGDKLRTQRNALGWRPPSLQGLGLDDETAAGRFVAGLSAESSISELEILCALTDIEKERIRELDRALADDPLRRAVAEDARGRLVQELRARVGSANMIVGDDAFAKFEQLVRERDQTRDVAEVARRAFSKNSDLSGIGTDVWRALWESARIYSETHAYSGEDFPVLKPDAVCVLCQQQLSPAAVSRLHSFEQFVKADAQQKADRASAALRTAVVSVRTLSLPRFVRGSLREAGLMDSPRSLSTRAFLIASKRRRRQLLRLADGRTGGRFTPLPEPPDLGPDVRAIEDEANRLRLAANDDERRSMGLTRAELRSRAVLSPHLETVRAEINRMKRAAEFASAIDDCKTQPITLKRREAAASVLTDRLRSSFQRNLLLLGFSESPVEVKLGAGEHGEHPVELKLIARPEVRPEEILSEGERTCVALAGLLAEVETTGNRAALVLDDPVSSLDHQYRKRVAERLIRAAKERQIIVLTHDITFFYLLRKYGGELDVPTHEVTLERGYRRNHGQAKTGPPWVAMTVSNCLKSLREEVLEARRLLKQGNRTEYDRRISDVYKKLRMSWERAIEEVLLYQTVVRFGDAVQTRRLEKLTDITEADVELVTREMSRCSDFEHDESGAVHADLPGPDVVEDDIRRLDDWVKELRTQRGRK